MRKHILLLASISLLLVACGKEPAITENTNRLSSDSITSNGDIDISDLPKEYASISKYFTDPHEHESMDDDYTKTVDLNGDGKNEKITIESLMANGGDGGYFNHEYNSAGKELVYQQDPWYLPFIIKWVDGSAIIYYEKQPIAFLDKDFIINHYKETLTLMDLTVDDDELTNTVMVNEEMRSDAASGFVITDNKEVIVKYYIEGKYGHVDCLGYGLLHLKLNKDNTWEISPEFVMDEM